MCKKLGIPRSLVYYKRKTRKIDSRRISKLHVREYAVLWKNMDLLYNQAFKVHKSTWNEEKIANDANRKFNDREYLEVVISDLTYVRVKDRWCDVCILIDLFNREIIGYSAGTKKNAELVYDVFLSSVNLSEIRIFHTDRGCEFKNKIIDELISTFGIKRSLTIEAVLMIMLFVKRHINF